MKKEYEWLPELNGTTQMKRLATQLASIQSHMKHGEEA